MDILSKLVLENNKLAYVKYKFIAVYVQNYAQGDGRWRSFTAWKVRFEIGFFACHAASLVHVRKSVVSSVQGITGSTLHKWFPHNVTADVPHAISLARVRMTCSLTCLANEASTPFHWVWSSGLFRFPLRTCLTFEVRGPRNASSCDSESFLPLADYKIPLLRFHLTFRGPVNFLQVAEPLGMLRSVCTTKSRMVCCY